MCNNRLDAAASQIVVVVNRSKACNKKKENPAISTKETEKVSFWSELRFEFSRIRTSASVVSEHFYSLSAHSICFAFGAEGLNVHIDPSRVPVATYRHVN